MGLRGGDPVALLRRSYAAGDDVDFGRFVASCGTESDDELADLIDADARERIGRGHTVDLDRYLSSVPGIRQRPEVLDTAIEMALLSLVRSDVPGDQAARTLAQQHPDLVDAIGTAAVLADALVSTQRLSRGLKSSKPRALPQDFGPVLEDGRGRYELRELLGSGSQGAVYLAVDRQLSEPQRPAWVAIKVLPEAVSGTRDRRRLAEEATKARSIVHPHVVRVLDRGVTPQDEEYVVFEHVAGGTLRGLVEKRSGQISVREAVEIAIGIARGVQAIHSAGLVHCDLKPDNVLIGDDGQPRVTDFGIAIRRGVDASTERGRRGNLGFMAPEQLETDGRDITSTADVYAVGAVLFWLLTGRVPNGETPDDAMERLRSARAGDAAGWPPSAATVRPEVDRDLAMVQCRAMSVTPRDRYASAEALATDLDLWLRREVIAWTRPGPGRRIALFARREPRTAAAVVGIMVVALLGVAAASRIDANARADREELAARAATEAAEARAKDAESQVSLAQAFSRSMLLSFRTEKGRLGEHWLPVITMFETMYGELLTATDQAGETAGLKLPIAGEIVADLESRGGAGWFETQQWRLVHGFWLAQERRYDEALVAFGPVADRWEQWLPEGDPYRTYVRGIVTATRVLADDAGGRPLAADPAADAALLERVLQSLGDRQRHWPVERLVARGLEVLYGPRGLNQPEQVARLRQGPLAPRETPMVQPEFKGIPSGPKSN